MHYLTLLHNVHINLLIFVAACFIIPCMNDEQEIHFYLWDILSSTETLLEMLKTYLLISLELLNQDSLLIHMVFTTEGVCEVAIES